MSLKVRGEGFLFDAMTPDLSAGGVCLRSTRRFNSGDTLDFLIELSLVGSTPPQRPRLSARGIVTRIRDLGDGTNEFAARFSHSKLL